MYSMSSSMNLRFSSLADKDFYQPCVISKHNIFNTFEFSSLASGGFFTHRLIRTLLKTKGKSLQMSFLSLCAALSSLIFSHENSNQCGLPKSSKPPPPFRKFSALCFESLLVLQLEKSEGNKMMHCSSYPFSFP